MPATRQRQKACDRLRLARDDLTPDLLAPAGVLGIREANPVIPLAPPVVQRSRGMVRGPVERFMNATDTDFDSGTRRKSIHVDTVDLRGTND
jgi:hypothetical protein